MSDEKDKKPIRMLVDTCVWLDLAKDYGQKSLLGALDDMVKRGHVSLILPQMVVDEFNRNKSRLIEDSARGAMNALKRAKDVTIQFAEPKRRMKVLHDLHEIDRKLVNVGDEVADGVVHALAVEPQEVVPG
jgi:PIN domain